MPRSASSSPKRIAIPLIQDSNFFAPPVLKILEAMIQGKLKSLPNDFSLKAQWPPDFQSKLWEFLNKGDLNFLPELLSGYPMAISHPVIEWEIWHLAKLVRLKDTKELQELEKECGWRPDESETILSPSDKATAKALLESILGTAVSKILPGYMVTQRPKARRAGRKPKHDEGFIFDCFFDFQSHCESLAKIFHHHAQSILIRKKTFWKPEQGESQSKFYARMQTILNELNNNSWHSRVMTYPSISRSTESSTGSATQVGGGRELSQRELTKLFQQKATVKYFPLSSEAILSMIKYATRNKYPARPKYTVDPRRLLYAFLAHWNNQKPPVMQGIIERYETDYHKEAVDLNALLYSPSPR